MIPTYQQGQAGRDGALGLTGILLHFDGANGSTTITESGPYPHTYSINGTGGTAQISTTTSVFGGSSYRQSGSTSRRIQTTSDVVNVTAAGSTPWTLEMRVNLDNFSAARVLFDNNSNLTNNTGWQVYAGTDAKPYIYSGTQAVSYGGFGSGLSSATWYALAFSWDGIALRFFVDGAMTGSNTGFDNPWGNSNLFIFNSAFTNQAAVGYLDEFRFTKGAALYTSDYIIATEAFS